MSEQDESLSVETTEIQEGYEPPVHDFTVEQNGEDFATSLLQELKLVMVVAYDRGGAHVMAGCLRRWA